MGSDTLISSQGYSLDFEEDNSDGQQDLVDCKNCGRHFAADRIQTHEWICQKQKKRKPFDICQQRIRGTDAEKYFKKKGRNSKAEKPMQTAQAQNAWRKQHEEFLCSMKAARMVTAHLKKGGNIRDLPPPPPFDYSDYVQCPNCLRKFNSSAAERHIPKCAEMQHKARPPPMRTGAVKATGPKATVQAPRSRK